MLTLKLSPSGRRGLAAEKPPFPSATQSALVLLMLAAMRPLLLLCPAAHLVAAGALPGAGELSDMGQLRADLDSATISSAPTGPPIWRLDANRLTTANSRLASRVEGRRASATEPEPAEANEQDYDLGAGLADASLARQSVDQMNGAGLQSAAITVMAREARKSRHLESTDASTSGASGAAGADGLESGTPLASISDELANQMLANQQQQQDGEPTVTCAPDYDDQPIVIDPGNMGDLFDVALAGQNQTAGERAASSSSASSNPSNSLRAASASTTPVQTNANGAKLQLMGQQQCVPAGNRMIEVITKIITPILFSIIIVVGLLGNIIVMLVILEDRKLERELTPTNLLILDLSLADLSFIIFCIPFTGWDYAVGHWVFGSLWCKFNQYLIVVCALSSIYTLVLMSCDRFMAIVYPIECINYRTSKNMLHAIIIKWIVILLIASPTIMIHGLVDSPLGPDQYNCRFLSDQHNPLHFQIIFFITSYLFPLILIFCLYLSLLNKLWFGQKPQGHKESHKMLESKKRVTWLVASIVIVFAACWFPIQIMLILMRLKSHKITATYVAIQVFAHTLGYMNSCVNPIVYAFASETFNQSFKKSWLGRLCMCCSKSSAHYYNNPTDGLTNSGAPSAGASNQLHKLRHLTEGNNVAANSSHQGGGGRSSMQALVSSSRDTNNRLQEKELRNRSLSHIFAHSNAVVMERSQNSMVRKPPLEPRDRPQATISPTMPLAPTNGLNHNSGDGKAVTSSSANPTAQTDINHKEQQQQQQQQQQAESSASGYKQQLVARVVSQKSLSNTYQMVVAHQCEPHKDDQLDQLD